MKQLQVIMFCSILFLLSNISYSYASVVYYPNPADLVRMYANSGIIVKTYEDCWSYAPVIKPEVTIRTITGAVGTSGESILCVIYVADEIGGQFEYRVNGGTWVSLPTGGLVELPVTQQGLNTINVEVRGPSRDIGGDEISIEKL